MAGIYHSEQTKSIALILIANSICGFAQGITMMLIPWYFTQLEQERFFILSYSVITFISIFWGVYAGTLIDSKNRKAIFLYTNLSGALLLMTAGICGIVWSVLPNWVIVCVFAIIFFSYYIHYPNLYAIVQEMTNPRYYSKVSTYIEVTGQCSVIAAAAVGTLLINGLDSFNDFEIFGNTVYVFIKVEKWDMYQIFLMDALTYALSFVIILFIKYKPQKAVLKENNNISSMFERIKTAHNFLMSNPVISVFSLCSYAIFIIVLVQIFTLLPLYIDRHLELGAEALGLSEFLYAGGSLLSGLLIKKIISRLSPVHSISYLTFVTAIAFLLTSLSKMEWVLYVFCFVIGFTNSGSRIFRVTYLFTIIPNQIAGRVNSMLNVLVTVIRIFFISLFSYSFFSEGSNITWAYFILGFFALLCAVILNLINKQVIAISCNSGTNISRQDP